MILLLAGQVSETGAQTKLEQAWKTISITKYLENSLKI
ncbi:MAG: hypothetical protein JWR38_4457 [Mucilaginibacter sp.]|nr:hypothetical protein [Mucilaginibacter sp.]